MNTPSLQQLWTKKIKWLTQALIVSGALNIGLLTTFIYFIFKGKESAMTFELKPTPKPTNSLKLVSKEQVLAAYSTLSFQELLLRLENKEHVEEGYTKRDLALACLVAFHHFNLERALGGLAIQKRQASFSNEGDQETLEISLYPGLADYQYAAVLQYAKMEKWPLTPKGLLFEIKRAPSPKDVTLVDAFYLTPEFHFLSTLFARSGLLIKKEVLLDLVTEGEWKTLADFANAEKENQDFSVERRRSLLLIYLFEKSKTAAQLLVETDSEFVAKKLDDAQLLQLLDLLSFQSMPVLRLAKELLDSPRSDAVLKKAASLLYTALGETIPEPYDQAAVFRRFFPHKAEPIEKSAITKVKAPIKTAATAKETGKKTYTVQQGDNLWKIARKHKVSVDALKKINHLDTEKLKPGRQLIIP